MRLCLLAIAGYLTATPALADVVIGVVAPLSGRYAEQGKVIRGAIENEIDRANRAGGIAGQTIAIEALDDRCDAKAGADAATKLVEQKVQVVIGHSCAGSALAAAPIYARANTLMLALTTHPDLTDRRAGPTIFRVAGREDRQGTAIARHIARRFANERIVLVHDRTRYASTAIQQIATELGRLNVPITAIESIVAGDKDYAPVVERIRKSGGRIVAFAGFPVEAAAILQQMRAAALSVQFIGTESLSEGLWTAAGKLADGAHIPVAASPEQNASLAIGITLKAARVSPVFEGTELTKVLSDLPGAAVHFETNGGAALPGYSIRELQSGVLKPLAD